MQNGKSYILGNVYFGIIAFSCLLSTKSCLIFLLICFVWEINFCQSSLVNKVDFGDVMNISPNILGQNQNFKKLRRNFVDERALITTTLISSCHWKILVTFCLWNNTHGNTFLTQIVNYPKIVQEIKLSHPNNNKLTI